MPTPRQLAVAAVLTVSTVAIMTPTPAAASVNASETIRLTLAPDTDAPRSASLLKKYDLNRKNLALDGYDPVAYFPEGDPNGKGKATKGDKKITLEHRGVTYRFSSAANRDLFAANPNRYEPAYGGWCAYAAANESYTSPDPKNFIVEDGRLFVFYKGAFSNTKSSWIEEGSDKLEPKADAFWLAETKESPRAFDVDGKPIKDR